jgi:hypothetical protein
VRTPFETNDNKFAVLWFGRRAANAKMRREKGGRNRYFYFMFVRRNSEGG